MKLKKCILSGVLAASMLCESLFGVALMNPIQVYADEGDESTEPAEGDETGAGHDAKFVNLAEKREVRTSGVDTGTKDVGSNAVDDDLDTQWTSVNLRNKNPQWIQIDLESATTDIERIEIVYGDGGVWDQGYTIETYDSERNTQEHTVRTVGASGPDQNIGQDSESRNTETKTDTILRNDSGQLMTISRYLRFKFTIPNNLSGTDAKHVTISEIRVFGSSGDAVYGPTINVTAPVDGKYPEVAEITLPKKGELRYHKVLTDLTYPYATLIRQNTGTRTQLDRVVGDSDVPAKVNQWTGGEAVELTGDELFLDDQYGFNAKVQTPGTNNKFDVWGHDIKIITCKVYFKEDIASQLSGNVNLFGYSDKMAVQMNGTKLYTYIEADGGKWPEEDLVFGQGDVPALKDLAGEWHELMLVVDGADGEYSATGKYGKQRLYLDGICSTTDTSSDSRKAAAIPKEVPGKGLHPFTIGFNYADAGSHGSGDIITTDQSKFNASLTEMNNRAFTSKHGYLADFEFYTNKNYHKFTDDEGTDISDAAVLSSAFENFSIHDLETATGGNKNDVYNIITNMLQKETLTGRISITPYNYTTVWSKKTDDGWVEVPATDKFSNVANTKYKATITLQADSGFIFDIDSARHIQEAWNLKDDPSVKSSIQIYDKRRQLVINAYYGCTDDDVEESCRINNVVVGSNPIKLVANGEAVSIGADVTMYTKCGKHKDAALLFEYALSDDNGGTITIDEENGTIQATESTGAVIGYKPIKLTITASLVEATKDNDGNVVITRDDDGNPIYVKSNNQNVTNSRTVDVEVDPASVADQEISVAPSITAQSPVPGKYPEVVEIAISDQSSHFEDVEDRMTPCASLDALTQDYIQNSEYMRGSLVTAAHNTLPARPAQTWVDSWENNAVVKNVDGVWAFNAVGQTAGDTDKYDVYGRDIKLVSFKLYLKEWPTKVAGQTGQNPSVVDIYGKGRKYAFQATSDKNLYMYMENESGDWPTEIFTPDNANDFLNKWHNVFMVVDGRGWQRLYVDGKPSTTRGATATNNNQGSAFAKERSGADDKPFSLGYNSTSNNPTWYNAVFTEKYGYIADFEFYTNRNYAHIIDGDGIDISEAQTLDSQLTENINLQQLEAKYGENVGIVLTNMLQESNATGAITATPYVAKTNWFQETEEGKFEALDKKNPTAFGYSARFQSVTTLTAYDGFYFKNDDTFKQEVKDNFTTEGGVQADTIEVNVKANGLDQENKVLEIIATYGETADAPCNCEIEVVTPPTPVAVEIPEEDETATTDLPEISEKDVEITCQKKGHPLSGRVLFSWAVAEGSEDKIAINEDMKIVAKKAGTATLKLTATFQTGSDEDGWTTYQNEDGEDVTTTINVTVTVTKAGAASEAEKTDLGTDVTNAKNNYPSSVEDDYKQAEWEELQNAITDADALSKDPNATSSAITAAKQRLADAIAALADAKSEKGLAKDALNGLLNDADLKALLATENKDKKYTADSWKKLTDAYANATAKVNTANAAELGTLKSTLETAWKGLVPDTTPVTGGTVKDGDVLTGADGTQYKVASAKDKTVIVTKGVDAKSIKVGPTVVIKNETYKVIGIGDKAYTGLKNATKVVIDANVASIGAQAFANSKKLKNVTIGQDVTTIGKKAFFKCPKLAKVTVKNNSKLSKVGGSAFKKASKKLKIKLPKNLKKNKKLKKQLKKAGIKKGL